MEIALCFHVVVRCISSNISGRTGPNFAIYSPYETALSGSVLYFPICQATLPWQPNNTAKMKANRYYVHSLHIRQLVSFCYDLLLMPLYRVKFCEDRSNSFGGEQSNRNCVACSRRGSAYVVQYLWMYWTDFRNRFTI